MNLLTKLFGNTNNGASTAHLTASEYKERFIETNTPHLLVDVRTGAEFTEDHLMGARNLPVQEMERRMGELPTDKPVILYCRSGNRSGVALQMLQAAGYTNVYNAGTLHELAKQGLPVN